MTAALFDFEAEAFERQERADWSALWAESPATFVNIETGEHSQVWARFVPLSAMWLRAFHLESCRVRPVGVITAAECVNGEHWTAERYLVRLALGVPYPRTSGEVIWSVTRLSQADFIELTPEAMHRLRCYHVEGVAAAGQGGVA